MSKRKIRFNPSQGLGHLPTLKRMATLNMKVVFQSLSGIRPSSYNDAIVADAVAKLKFQSLSGIRPSSYEE